MNFKFVSIFLLLIALNQVYSFSSKCNSIGTKRILENELCECKPNVIGRKCNQCAVQSFHFSPKGCINCFCMGMTGKCKSSSYFRDTIHASFASPQTNFSLITDYENPKLIANYLTVENNELIIRNITSDETFYWSLPQLFLDNKITAYGGDLSYTFRYTSQPSSTIKHLNSPEVVLISDNEITLHHYRYDNTPPTGNQKFIVPMIEKFWRNNEDGRVVLRQHFLMALANVTQILIKATYTTATEEASLSQVSLDNAKEQNFGSNQRAVEVEECDCPLGHEGLSCEYCSPNYFKSDEGLYLGICEQCDCNGHSDVCDSTTGVCSDCRHNTHGDNCELCLPGFHGDATSDGCFELIKCFS